MMSVSPSGRNRKAWDLNPYPREEARISSAARLTVSGYLPYVCQWTHPESNWDCRHARAVSCRWTMSPCFFSGPDGNRTHHTDLARISRLPWYMPARLSEVRPGIEPGLRPYHGRVLPEHLQTVVSVIPAGIEPAVSCTSRRRLRHWTTGSCQ